MANIAPLTDSEIQAGLARLDGWSIRSGKLHREFRFRNFVEAFAFMTKVAITAEGMNHHPEWTNIYNRVTIDLMTHDAGDAISQLDLELAGKIDALVP